MPRGRKPADRQMIGGVTPRSRIWTAVRALRRFSLDDLARRAQCDAGLVQSYGLALQAAGFIAREADAGADGSGRREDGSFPRVVYRLVRDCGVEAPRLRPDGSASRAGEVQQAIWTACRIVRTFNWREVAKSLVDGEIRASEASVKHYILVLARAGYFAQIGPARPGVPARWRLQTNSGPKAPLIQRTKRVWDVNLGRVVWERSEELAELDEPSQPTPEVGKLPARPEPARPVSARAKVVIKTEDDLIIILATPTGLWGPMEHQRDAIET